MKEKIKNFFTNKAIWEYIVGFIALIITIFLTYSKGFYDGIFIDDNIRTQIIEAVNDELKKPKIEPKKQNDIDKYSPLETIGKYTKVYFNINEDFISDFYDNLCNFQTEFTYVPYASEDDLIYVNITFNDSQDPLEFVTFDLTINELYLYFEVRQNLVSELSFSAHLNIYEGMNYKDILYDLGEYIALNSEIIGLNNYYLNQTSDINIYADNENFTLNHLYTYDIQKEVSFFSSFLSGAAELVSGFGAVLSAAVLSVGTIFYNDGGLTIIGAAMAFALVVGVVYLIFRMVRGLVKQNNRG